MRAVLIAAAAAGVLGAALWPGPAAAQVTGRQLLGWCQGALGQSVTAEFDAFQCTAYLQAMLDQHGGHGIDYAACLGTARPGAADLMAQIMPLLRARAAEGGAALDGPANAIVADWIDGHCAALVPGSGPSAEEPVEAQAAPDSAPASDDPAIELAIWQAVQRIQDPDRQRAGLEHYLETYPDGRFARLARLQIDELAAPPPPAPEPPAADPDAEAQDGPEAPSPDTLFWLSIKDSEDPEAYEEYLRRFPDGLFSGLARRRIERFTELPAPAPPQPAPRLEPEPQPEPPPGPTAAERALAEARALDAGLGRQERREVQDSLRRLGLYRMGIDGIFGNGTRGAIRDFQRGRGEDPTGYLTAAQMQALRAAAPPNPPAEPAPAPSGRRIVVNNLGATAIVSIFASPTSYDNWEHNRLGGNVLLPGHSLVVPLPGYGATCDFDVRLIDEYNSIREVWRLDVCRQERVDFF
jgi:hypothetical protein